MTLALGMEIGGTKLQVGLGGADGRPLAVSRGTVDPVEGAAGIRATLVRLAEEACHAASVDAGAIAGVGIGFGGPVDTRRGVTFKSFHIDGWDGFPLVEWAERQWKAPAAVENDASLAGLAEWACGAGEGAGRLFYITIGSGIGGGCVVDGRIDGGQGLGAAEIGHTWVPHPETGAPTKLEDVCSGWSIGRRAGEAVGRGERSAMAAMVADPAELTARHVHEAAVEGDALAARLLEQTTDTLALAIGNVIALLAPERIIIGGGVSLMGRKFWDPLHRKVHERAFDAFRDSFELRSAALGEQVVVVGGILLGHRAAARRARPQPQPQDQEQR